MEDAIYNRAFEILAEIEKLNFFENEDCYKDFYKHIDAIEAKGIRAYYGCSKFCLTTDDFDYVIKFDIRTTDYDCQREIENYANACGEGFEEYFPKTEFLCKKYNRIFTLQAKAMIDPDLIYERLYQDIDSRTDDYCWANDTERENHIDDEIWNLSDEDRIFALLGKSERIFKLVDFLNRNCIDDLHTENLGFINDKIVITDFSGCC